MVKTSLPPFPAVAQKLLRLIGQDNCPIPELAKAAKSDAVFSAEILRLANSAIVGSRFEVVSVLHAISTLGLERLRALVITLAMRSMIQAARSTARLRISWRHNFACALACEWMACSCDLSRAAAYSCGLLHELGRIAMIVIAEERYTSLLEEATETGIDLEILEREFFGMDHLEAGRQLAEAWQLPQSLIAATCQRRPDPGAPFSMAHLVAVGCQVADQCGFSLTGETVEWDPAIVGAILPDHAIEQLIPYLNQMHEEIPFKVRTFEQEFLAK